MATKKRRSRSGEDVELSSKTRTAKGKPVKVTTFGYLVLKHGGLMKDPYAKQVQKAITAFYKSVVLMLVRRGMSSGVATLVTRRWIRTAPQAAFIMYSAGAMDDTAHLISEMVKTTPSSSKRHISEAALRAEIESEKDERFMIMIASAITAAARSGAIVYNSADNLVYQNKKSAFKLVQNWAMANPSSFRFHARADDNATLVAERILEDKNKGLIDISPRARVSRHSYH